MCVCTCGAFRVHSRLITLYGEEVDEAESTVSCSCIWVPAEGAAVCELGPRHIAILTIGSRVPSVGASFINDAHVCHFLSINLEWIHFLHKLGHMHTNILETGDIGDTDGEIGELKPDWTMTPLTHLIELYGKPKSTFQLNIQFQFHLWFIKGNGILAGIIKVL